MAAIPLRRIRNTVIPVGFLTAIACSPSAPSPVPVPTPEYTTTVRTVSVLNLSVAVPQVTLTVAGRADQMTDAAGLAVLSTSSPTNLALRLRHPAMVEREVSVRVPADGTAVMSLIPATHDLAAFEEFSPRTAGLQRWTTSPRLMVLDHAVDYSGGSQDFREYPVINRPITASQLDCLAAGIAGMLAEMSGGHLGWTSIETVAVAPGSRFRTDTTPEGTIVVLPAITLGSVGRGTAYTGAQSSVLTRGAIWISAETQNFCLTSLLYKHELGHALGYLHVTRTLSIMGSPGLPPALTDFDRQSIEILFQRPPGNRTPDRDPSGSTVNSASSQARRPVEPMR